MFSDWGQGFHRSPEDKIQQNIKAIREVAQLDSLGELITEVNNTGFPSLVTRLAIDPKPFANYETFQAVAIGMILPVVLNPAASYDFLRKLVSWENFQRVSTRFQLPCVMKLIRAAALSRKAADLLNEHIVMRLWESDQIFWQMPMLYLTFEAGEPWDIGIQPGLTDDVRTDTLDFYYNAMNQLMARKYVMADLLRMSVRRSSTECH
jgi:hypothetical protein